MYCKLCGKLIDADVLFCQFCGKPQQPGVHLSGSEPQWEACTLQAEGRCVRRMSWLRPLTSERWAFRLYAQAVGPLGSYVAAEDSQEFEIDTADGVWNWYSPRVQEFVQRLLTEGWEYAEGEQVRTKFRRQVTSERIRAHQERLDAERERQATLKRGDVALMNVGPNKIQVINIVRELTGLGLAEAKDFVENAPGVLLADVDLGVAEATIARLDQLGATAILR